jgi:hypothetical protein
MVDPEIIKARILKLLNEVYEAHDREHMSKNLGALKAKMFDQAYTPFDIPRLSDQVWNALGVDGDLLDQLRERLATDEGMLALEARASGATGASFTSRSSSAGSHEQAASRRRPVWPAGKRPGDDVASDEAHRHLHHREVKRLHKSTAMAESRVALRLGSVLVWSRVRAATHSTTPCGGTRASRSPPRQG